ncbi:MAG: DUF1801 domain-containing protein [Calditrichia bacterium]
MAELKTKPGQKTVEEFLENVDPAKKEGTLELLKLMKSVTGEEPVMWGNSIVGFGNYHYKYESGREGDWFLTGFSPRKQNFTVYIMPGFQRYQELISNLGKYKTGKGCLYFKKLPDINQDVLRDLISHSVQYLKSKYK